MKMQLVRVVWEHRGAEKTSVLRDPREQGRFLCGIECDTRGISIRHGCVDDPELMIHRSHIRSVEPVS